MQTMTVAVMFSDFFDENVLFAPMIDARRMEVYTAVHDFALENAVAASVDIDEDSYREQPDCGPVIFFWRWQ